MVVDEFPGTQELVEMVQLLLPPVDIMVSMRICRSFRDSYDASVKLKTMVHPAKEAEENWTKQSRDFQSSDTYIRQPEPDGGFVINGPEPIDGVVANPIIFTDTKLGRCIKYKTGRGKAIAILNLSKVGLKSSCNDMLLTQPPIKTVGFVNSTHDYFQNGCPVSNSEGVRVGDIFEKCGPAARVCVHLGNVKVMELEYMERMRAKGRYVETWREVFIDGFTPGWRLSQYLDEDDISRLAAVNLALLWRYRPHVARMVFRRKR